MTVERDPELQALLDKQAIREVVLRYCRGVDRHDRDLVRDCYWPDAVDEHGSFTGTRDEYLTWLFDRMLTRYSMTMHFVGNILVEVEGARATSEAYGVSWHRGLADHAAPERGGDDLMSAFRYVDQMERRDLGGSGGVWRIARRTCTLEWARVNERAGWWDAPPAHRRGVRDRTDPVYWPWGRHFPWPLD
jgi:hypothetical protein